jgi:hypothetical protein
VDALAHLYREFQEEPARLAQLLDDLTLTVGGSFLADGSTMTKREVKRRLQICATWVLTLRKDLHWSLPRIIDELPKALRCALDGLDYAPSREGATSWGAHNARNLIWLPPG